MKMNQRLKDFMIDIETLGTGENAVILSIGAIAFDPVSGIVDKNDTFYCAVSYSDRSQPSRKIDPATLAWWLTQDKTAFDAAFSGERELKSALLDLKNWLPQDRKKDISGVWANGASFDLGILRNAFLQFEIGLPWGYGQEMCMRSLRRLSNIQAKRDGVYHNALDDAITQAFWVCEIVNSGVINALEVASA